MRRSKQATGDFRKNPKHLTIGFYNHNDLTVRGKELAGWARLMLARKAEAALGNGEETVRKKMLLVKEAKEELNKAKERVETRRCELALAVQQWEFLDEETEQELYADHCHGKAEAKGEQISVEEMERRRQLEERRLELEKCLREDY